MSTSTTRRPLFKSDYQVALQIYKRLTDRYNSYLEECEEDRKQGYRPHYCEHGTNQHTDWDNICGACEDGYSMRNPQARREEALRQAREYYDKHMELVTKFSGFMSDLDNEDRDTLWNIFEKKLSRIGRDFGIKTPWDK